MKHAEFHYLDPSVIARDFPPLDVTPAWPAGRPTRWAGTNLTAGQAFTLAKAGHGRGPAMQRIELTCWAETQPHTLGQIITDTTGRLLIDPWVNAGQPSVGQIGGRLVASCHACRHAGRTLTTALELTQLCALAAALAFTATTGDGDHPRRAEARVQAQADAINRATRELIAGLGHEDSHRRRQRLKLRAQLIRQATQNTGR